MVCFFDFRSSIAVGTVVLLLGLFTPAAAFAQPTPAENPTPAPATIKVTDYISNAHQKTSEQVLWLANKVDSLFGDQRATDEINKTTLRISQGALWDIESARFNETDINFSLKLPTLNRRGKELLETVTPGKRKSEPMSDESLAQETTDAELDPRFETTLFPASRLQRFRRDWNFHVEPGVRIGSEFQYQVRGRVRRTFEMPLIANHFSHQATWNNSTLWRTELALNSDIQLADFWLLRFVNSANWQISEREFDSAHGPSLIWQIGDSSATALNVRINSSTESGAYAVRSYNAGVSYNRLLMGKWMNLEIGPGTSFARAEKFKPSWFLAARIEIIYGHF